MQHAVTQPIAPFKTADGRLEIHGIPVWMDNLSWLAVCTQTGAAVVVDGPDAPPVLAKCAELGVELTGVLNTHVHHDHIGVNKALAKAGLLDGLTVCGPASRADKVPGITRGVGEGDVVSIGAVEGRVWLTEGHLNGHISFLFGDALFCGDTLFAGGCGYMFDGPAATFHASLQRLAGLDGGTRVVCAHEYTQDNLRFAWFVEPDNAALAARIGRTWTLRAQGACTVPSTIAEERATNPFLRVDSATLHRRLAEELPEHPLGDGAAVFAATRALKNTKRHKDAVPDTALPLG